MSERILSAVNFYVGTLGAALLYEQSPFSLRIIVHSEAHGCIVDIRHADAAFADHRYVVLCGGIFHGALKPGHKRNIVSARYGSRQSFK